MVIISLHIALLLEADLDLQGNLNTPKINLYRIYSKIHWQQKKTWCVIS